VAFNLCSALVVRLGENESRVLILIRADPRISTRIMAENICVSTTAVDKAIAKLKDKGVLIRLGPPRGGHWEIREATEDSKLDPTPSSVRKQPHHQPQI